MRQALGKISQKKASKDDLLIMLDADATYHPEEIPRFIDNLLEFDVVWGSRMRGEIESRAMSMTNKIGNKLLSLAASLIFLKRTTDLCTGYWGFRLDGLEKLRLTAEGFTLEADLFGSVVKSKLKLNEIPVDYAHRQGNSTLKWYSDGPRILFMTMKRRFVG